MAKTAYQLWLEDQNRKNKQAQQDAAQGKINFREASTASRPQYTLPGYQGQSETKNYDWETSILGGIKGKGVGRSNNDKFDYVTKRLGMTSGQADDFRNFLDFQYDSQQSIKTNKDGTVSKGQNVRPGQGAMLQNDVMNGIFNNMNQRMTNDIQTKQKAEIEKAKQQMELSKQVSKERPGLLGILDSTFGRIGNAAHSVFGQDFVNAENQNYANLAADKLKKNPKDKHSIEAIQMLNNTTRAPKNGLEKASDFIGTSAGELAPYTLGGYGVADALISKTALNNPIAKDLIRGAIAGTIAGTEKAAVKKVVSNEDVSPMNIAMEAGLAGGGDALLGGVLRNLNLKGQLDQVLKGTKSQAFNAEEFQKALQEAYGPKGDVSNVLADQVKQVPQFTPKYSGTLNPKTLDSFVPNEIPKVDVPATTNEWFNFAQKGTKPTARGSVPQTNVGQYTKELISNKGDNILNQVDALKNAPKGGYNQRLLDIQKEMQTAGDKRGIYRTQLSPDELYLKVKGQNDPATFDDLIKLAEMENNVANAPVNIKTLLRNDPKVADAIKKLNALGGKPKETVIPNPDIPSVQSFDEFMKSINQKPINPASNGIKLNIPPVKGNEDPLSKLQALVSNSKKNEPSVLDLAGNQPKTFEEALSRLTDKVKQYEYDTGKKFSKKTYANEYEKINQMFSGGKQSAATIEPKVNYSENISPVTKKLGVSTEDNHGYGLINAQSKKITSESISPKRTPKLVNLYEERKDLLKADLANLAANSEHWKDKSAPLLKRETMYRNFEDIMGKDAEKMKKTLLDPIGQKEAESVRFKNQAREEIGKFKIKGNTKDSALVQKYGEGLISLDELKQQTRNWENVVDATEKLKGFYKEILPKANEELVKNGYDPIPERKDYFPHAEDLTAMQKFLKKHVGIDFEDHTLPTDINGLTGNFKPGKQFFGNALQRKGELTNYDAIANFDRYIEGISNVIYHTENIKRLRAFEQVLRTKHAETQQLSNFVSELDQFTNMLAGKKVGLDHMAEKYTGRKLYTFVDNMRKRTAANMLAYNVASPLTNTIPALTQAPALTGKKYFVRGMMDTLGNVVKKDGFETDFLTRRLGSDPLYRDFWGKATDKGFWLMKTIDKFASETIVRSKYYELLDKGIAENEAKRQADEFAAKIMADRSKGQLPTLFADKTLSLLTQFQLEVNNQMSFMFKDIPKMSKGKAAMASAYAQVFLYSYLFNNLFEKMTGRRPAFDPVGVVTKSIKDYNNPNITKGEATWNTIENIGNQLPFASMFTGGRYPIEAGVPQLQDVMQGKSTWGKELAKPLTYIVPPTGGGAAKRVYQAATDNGLNPISPQKSTGYYKGSGDSQKLVYPIESSKSRALQELLFGRSALPESTDYYDNKRTPLSEKQTKAYDRLNQSGAGKEFYDLLRVNGNLKASDKGKFTKIEKDNTLSDQEKLQKMVSLLQQLRNK